MIYVFNGAKEICSLPGRACTACGECLGQMNCEPLKNVCSGLGACFVTFLDKPLSTYVLVKALLSALLLVKCFLALSEPGLSLCVMQPVDITTWLYVMTSLGFLHLFFAPYFQVRVWHQLEKSIADQPPGDQPITIPATTVHEAFKEVFLHDVGILFYFCVLVFAYIWAWLGSSWLDSSLGCILEGHPAATIDLTYAICYLAAIYTSLYYFCSCCAGSVQLRREGSIVPAQPANRTPTQMEMT